VEKLARAVNDLVRQAAPARFAFDLPFQQKECA
jgi:hypothetical protein